MFFRLPLFIFSLFRQFDFLTKMTGLTDDGERPHVAAPSTSSTSTPIDTDDYIHQMVVRLSPNEDVVRRNRPGKPNFQKFSHNLLLQHRFQSLMRRLTLMDVPWCGFPTELTNLPVYRTYIRGTYYHWP